MLNRIVRGGMRRIGLAFSLTPEKTFSRLPIAVDEVIDVGVRYGTPFLYNAFPDAKFLLVDPQKGGESLMKSKPKSYKFLNIGLSDAPGKLVLNEQGGKSTYLDRTSGTASAVDETYETELQTLDWIIQNEMKSNSIGVKVDVEGFEDRVIAGFNTEIERVRFVVMETSVRQRFEASYSFSDIVCLMRERGFYFYNVMNTAQCPAPPFYDVLFLRKGDPLFVM